MSTYLGVSWQPTGPKFKDPYQVHMSEIAPKAVVVATGPTGETQYLYSSNDGGKSWVETKWRPSLPALQIRSDTERLSSQLTSFTPPSVRSGVDSLNCRSRPATGNILIYRSDDGGRTCRLASILRQPTSQRPWPQLRNDENKSDRSS